MSAEWYNCQDGCFSTDSDIFLFGARTVYRDIFLGEFMIWQKHALKIHNKLNAMEIQIYFRFLIPVVLGLLIMLYMY